MGLIHTRSFPKKQLVKGYYKIYITCMNKFNKILVLAVLTTLVSARTSCNSPSYYNSVNKKTGYSLKSELSRIISSTHKNNSYDSLYRAYEMGDSDTTFDNDGTVLDIYSEDPKRE